MELDEGIIGFNECHWRSVEFSRNHWGSMGVITAQLSLVGVIGSVKINGGQLGVIGGHYDSVRIDGCHWN